MKQGKVKVPELNATVSPYLVQSSPPVLSVGLRCVEDGFDFVWRGSKNEKPKLVSPDGKVIELEVRDYVPYLCSKSNQSNVSTVAKSNNNGSPMNFFSVQRLHGFRQVVQHVSEHVAIGIN